MHRFAVAHRVEFTPDVTRSQRARSVQLRGARAHSNLRRDFSGTVRLWKKVLHARMCSFQLLNLRGKW